MNKLYLIFVQGIFWFHEILKRIQFAGCLTLQNAMNARVKICISRPKGVKCGWCHPFYIGTSCLKAVFNKPATTARVYSCFISLDFIRYNDVNNLNQNTVIIFPQFQRERERPLLILIFCFPLFLS